LTRKLLLADDSVTIQRVVELTFSGEDIDVVAVSDGEQAIAHLRAETPDIVLADIAMPKKNGYEVAAFMKEHPALSRVPVLLLAGAFEPVDEERAKRVKCDGVLVKPFETHEVITRVRELLDGDRQTAQEAPAVDAPRGEVVQMPHTAPRADSEQSLDDYFDRLDVAFATRAQNPPRPFPHLSPPAPERPDAAAMVTPSAEPQVDTESRTAIADLFKAFFEVEQGERDAASIRIPDEISRLRRGHTIE
jgi:CheY-like chemotaxis protein